MTMGENEWYIVAFVAFFTFLGVTIYIENASKLERDKARYAAITEMTRNGCTVGAAALLPEKP